MHALVAGDCLGCRTAVNTWCQCWASRLETVLWAMWGKPGQVTVTGVDDQRVTSYARLGVACLQHL